MLHFVDPEDGTHTNSIESIWCSAKTQFKQMRGVSRQYLSSYLDEFTWRKNISLERTDAVDSIIEVLGKTNVVIKSDDLAELMSGLTVQSTEPEILDVEDIDFEKLDLPLYEELALNEEQTESATLRNRLTTHTELSKASVSSITSHQSIVHQLISIFKKKNCPGKFKMSIVPDNCPSR
ncbi:unnamed protein product [Brachionus calyciflorus]|uniref:ISXO2-like transposase domain-containing protein n=1 Tax=Brachionus calyciflorus TaxID=104777 RepID=A0A813RUD5_9BILA|nr:unnamed protein product [Brachionus calyciflorus]